MYSLIPDKKGDKHKFCHFPFEAWLQNPKLYSQQFSECIQMVTEVPTFENYMGYNLREMFLKFRPLDEGKVRVLEPFQMNKFA